MPPFPACPLKCGEWQVAHACVGGGNKQWQSNLKVTEVDFVTTFPKNYFKNEINLFTIKRV